VICESTQGVVIIMQLRVLTTLLVFCTSTKARSVNKKNCFEEVQFFGTISWRELKSYQKNRPTDRKETRASLLSCTISWQRGGGAKLDSAAAAPSLTARLHSAAS
jgi:hypothetical protein